DQMIFMRPLPELANYKTPIQGLYLTGAGTHPGGSISGMPGRNCARVFLSSQRPIAQAVNKFKDSFAAVTRSMLGIV
ncbi:MAG: NAD(P)/FAD-dependent oxidoreductase, partial [Leptolyngbyaceae cyanobacterium RM2_2_4]|nr:NAD(P)/FAD-dependent oxidoreductase [Leptolyngbyaceae cyanobacterium RM2_2_4]